MKFIREHFLSIILFLILSISLILGVQKAHQWKVFGDKIVKEMIVECQNYNGKYEDEIQENDCEQLLNNNDPYYVEYFQFFGMIDAASFLPLTCTFIQIILLVICFSYYICHHLKNKVISNYIYRETYPKYKKRLILNTWLPVLIVPILMTVKIIICYIYTGNWDTYSGNPINGEVSMYLFTYVALAFLKILTFSNVTLIVSRKQHNFILSAVLSFLAIIAIELSLECVVNPLIHSITNSDIGLIFNIIAYGDFADPFGLIPPLIFAVCTAILSFIVVELMYKDGEKLVIDCEAN